MSWVKVKSVCRKATKVWFGLHILVPLLLCIYALIYATYLAPNSKCSMSWSSPEYTAIETTKNRGFMAGIASKYHFYRHTSRFNYYSESDAKKNKYAFADMTNMSVIFIPGNGGCRKQVRSIAARVWRHEFKVKKLKSSMKHINYQFYTTDFSEELSALSPQIIIRQRDYIWQIMSENCGLFENNPIYFIGHSMGGIVAASLLEYVYQPIIASQLSECQKSMVTNMKALVMISTPLFTPVFTFENDWLRFYYAELLPFLKSDIFQSNDKITLKASFSGGIHDHLIDPILSYSRAPYPISYAIGGVESSILREMDHQATVWCHDMVETISWQLVSMASYGSVAKQPPKLSAMFAKLPISDLTDDITEGYTLVRKSVEWKADDRQSFKDIPLRYSTNQTNIVLICNAAVTQLNLCEKGECVTTPNVSDSVMTVPTFVNRDTHNLGGNAFVPRFVSVISSESIFKESSDKQKQRFLEVSTQSPIFATDSFNQKCSLWQGYTQSTPFHTDLSNIFSPLFQSKFKPDSGHIIAGFHLPSSMFHDLSIRISLPASEQSQTCAKQHLCVSGFSGSKIAPINGIYDEMTSADGRTKYFKQIQSFWYTPEWNFKQKHSLFIFTSDKHKNQWTIGKSLKGDHVVAVCEDTSISNSPFECETWSVFEGSNYYRRENRIEMNWCDANQLGLLHIKKEILVDNWFAINNGIDTTHRIIVPRAANAFTDTTSLLYSQLIELEIYLDAHQITTIDEMIITIEYHWFSSMLKTIRHDIYYLPYLVCVVLTTVLTMLSYGRWRHPTDVKPTIAAILQHNAGIFLINFPITIGFYANLLMSGKIDFPRHFTAAYLSVEINPMWVTVVTFGLLCIYCWAAQAFVYFFDISIRFILTSIGKCVSTNGIATINRYRFMIDCALISLLLTHIIVLRVFDNQWCNGIVISIAILSIFSLKNLFLFCADPSLSGIPELAIEETLVLIVIVSRWNVWNTVYGYYTNELILIVVLLSLMTVSRYFGSKVRRLYGNIGAIFGGIPSFALSGFMLYVTVEKRGITLNRFIFVGNNHHGTAMMFVCLLWFSYRCFANVTAFQSIEKQKKSK